jgi:hypothetical protein
MDPLSYRSTERPKCESDAIPEMVSSPQSDSQVYSIAAISPGEKEDTPPFLDLIDGEGRTGHPYGKAYPAKGPRSAG